MEKEKGFLLLKPRKLKDAGKIAKAIAMCKGVKEVFLTSGEYGFVATIETNVNGGIQDIGKMVEKGTRCVKASTVIKHYIYRKK